MTRRSSPPRLQAATRQAIAEIFERQDYAALGAIYCYDGGDEFWREKRGPCQKLGIAFAEVLLGRLKPGGKSLYVGAGVAEIPMLAMETMELGREVQAYNLREAEVILLNQACKSLPFQYQFGDAGHAEGQFNHLWIVSVLNDPERFPELASLSYGEANPAAFDVAAFTEQRETVLALAYACLDKLVLPGLVTTSVEEIPWVMHWSEARKIPHTVEKEDHPTAIVGDPICLIRIGEEDGKTAGLERRGA